ncbi:MAG: GNAT family N-acetyltransferase [Bacteroidetes bacterium]|nr:GNAT family N-acetyltransferase [Bacteroidota bacterium]
MSIQLIKDKTVLEKFFRKNTALNIYQLGDLDEFYWPHTEFYGYYDNDELKSVVMIYREANPNVVIALSNENNIENLKKAISQMSDILPDKIYFHISTGIENVLEENYTLNHEGKYLKMSLTDSSKLDNIDITNVEQFTIVNKEELNAFYEDAYPGNSFIERMLETGMFYGIREEGKIEAVAGIHVYSPEYKVAALGSITTHPNSRGKGYATKVTACLCKELFKNVEVIGLNVHSENSTAIHCYEKLGFVKIADYLEITAICK